LTDGSGHRIRTDATSYERDSGGISLIPGYLILGGDALSSGTGDNLMRIGEAVKLNYPGTA